MWRNKIHSDNLSKNTISKTYFDSPKNADKPLTFSEIDKERKLLNKRLLKADKHSLQHNLIVENKNISLAKKRKKSKNSKFSVK